MNRTREIIVQLLENIGGRKEVAEYLRRYTSSDAQRYAVVTFARDVNVDERADDVAAALSFLHQVGMYPLVVLRGRDTALALTDALEAHGCRARPITSGVFLGEGDAIDAIDDVEVVAALRAQTLPIITVHALSAVAAVRALAQHIQPHKIVLLDNEGGLLGLDDKPIEAINLAEDLERLDLLLDGPQRSRLDRFIPLLEDLPSFVSLSVTSPEHLARELFTHRGAGTLVRRGEAVVAHDSFDDVDTERLRKLVGSCFERDLVVDYFETKRCRRVYLTESYRATAIITEERGDALVVNETPYPDAPRYPDTPPYLDKFAVTKKAQGEGIGSSLWRRVRADYDKLFWRSRADNPVNPWYFQQADGSHRDGPWTVFWYGLESFADIERCIRVALTLPPTLEPGRG